MMEIKTNFDEKQKTVILWITGRINTSSVREFEQALEPYYATCDKMILDFTNVEFISSSGLRVLVDADEAMRNHGTLCIRNINSGVREVLNMTGFIDMLTVE